MALKKLGAGCFSIIDDLFSRYYERVNKWVVAEAVKQLIIATLASSNGS
jgi:hypothetical protein